MPNWCHTNINIYSDNTEAIRDLNMKIKSFAADRCDKTAAPANWMGNLLLHAGFDYAEIKSGKLGYVQGYVMYVGEYVERAGFGSFEMDLSDSWSPDIRAVRSLIAKLYPKENIRIAYIAEEPGTEIFEKYDPDELFYSSYEYYVDYIVPEEVKLVDYPEIIEDIGTHTSLDILKAFGTDVYSEVKKRCRQITAELQAAYQDGGYVIHRYDILVTEC